MPLKLKPQKTLTGRRWLSNWGSNRSKEQGRVEIWRGGVRFSRNRFRPLRFVGV
jgi:hypothetical protein